MTDQQRYKKLQDAHDLIRDVEFSYAPNSPYRELLYKVVVRTFGFTSLLGGLMEELKKNTGPELEEKK